MRIEYLVSPREDGWLLSRGRSAIQTYATQQAAIRAADNMARAAARQEHARVKLDEGDGLIHELAAYRREGFLRPQ